MNEDFLIVDGCLEKYKGSAKEKTIPESVAEIGKYAFRGCYSLESIVIPDSVKNIGVDAFRYCNSLTEIKVAENNKVYDGEKSASI